jgi:hypothetical protein
LAGGNGIGREIRQKQKKRNNTYKTRQDMELGINAYNSRQIKLPQCA